MNEYKQKCLETWQQIKDADLSRRSYKVGSPTMRRLKAFEELLNIKSRVSANIFCNCPACEVAVQKLRAYECSDAGRLGFGLHETPRCFFCPVNWSKDQTEVIHCQDVPAAYNKLQGPDALRDWDALIDEMIECIILSRDEDWEIQPEVNHE